jgi:hypothetical protein
MFLRKTPRKKDGKTHDYWSVVENKRVAGGRVVQRHVLYLGEINSSQAAVWRKAIEVLNDDAGHPQTMALFPEDRCTGLAPDRSIVQLRLSDIRLCRPRQWGACWLAGQFADSGHRDQPIRLIVITQTGDRDHAAHLVEECLVCSMRWHWSSPLTVVPSHSSLVFVKRHERDARNFSGRPRRGTRQIGHQSRPYPRGGTMVVSSSRSRSTMACKAAAVAESRRLSGKASHQAAYSACKASSPATASCHRCKRERRSTGCR